MPETPTPATLAAHRIYAPDKWTTRAAKPEIRWIPKHDSTHPRDVELTSSRAGVPPDTIILRFQCRSASCNLEAVRMLSTPSQSRQLCEPLPAIIATPSFPLHSPSLSRFDSRSTHCIIARTPCISPARNNAFHQHPDTPTSAPNHQSIQRSASQRSVAVVPAGPLKPVSCRHARRPALAQFSRPIKHRSTLAVQLINTIRADALPIRTSDTPKATPIPLY